MTQDRIPKSARGEECQIRYVAGCNFDPATTCWAHSNSLAAGKGVGLKSLTLLGAYACSNCHDIYDGRRQRPEGMSLNDVRLGFYEGHERSLVILERKGLL